METAIESVPAEFQLTVSIVLIVWVSGLASAVIDNIPFTTMMIPIVLGLAENKVGGNNICGRVFLIIDYFSLLPLEPGSEPSPAASGLVPGPGGLPGRQWHPDRRLRQRSLRRGGRAARMQVHLPRLLQGGVPHYPGQPRRRHRVPARVSCGSELERRVVKCANIYFFIDAARQ